MTEPRGGIAARRLQRVAPDSLEDLRRIESRIAVARSVAVPWTFLQVLVYHTQPYPPGVKTQGLLLAAALLVGDVAILVARSRLRTAEAARRLSLAALAFDLLVASGFVWLYTFDQSSALWAILFILPLEGATRFDVPGALGTWAAMTALYVGREVWGSGRYHYPLAFDSISFRMGLALIIGLVGGLAFRDLHRERRRLALALDELGRVDRFGRRSSQPWRTMSATRSPRSGRPWQPSSDGGSGWIRARSASCWSEPTSRPTAWNGWPSGFWIWPGWSRANCR